HLIRFTHDRPNCAVLTGYELSLSRLLKTGSDIWLNTPRITREASGTSGMTAAMNGSINLTTFDGWIPEFAKNRENCFVIPPIDHTLALSEQDRLDAASLYQILEQDVLPTYYNQQDKWIEMVFAAIDGVIPAYTSNRMAHQYFQLLY
ncbi:MAG: glycogen/starch/alpha-glucan phosphorylase, partial [Cyclobacteriaceae bacterium]|nr:glycogen/starch/alpha-glucan phosphorylase [Cyclobacteriaceae bacterium]